MSICKNNCGNEVKVKKWNMCGPCYSEFIYTPAGRAEKFGKRTLKDDIEYEGAHIRLRRTKGPASEHVCVDCGGAAHEWALCHDSAQVVTSKTARHFGSMFSPDPRDYEARCRKCHGAYDAKHGLKRKKPVIDSSAFNARPETYEKAHEAARLIKSGATASSVAEAMGVTPSAVTRWFVLVEGKSVSQWRAANKAVAV